MISPLGFVFAGVSAKVEFEVTNYEGFLQNCFRGRLTGKIGGFRRHPLIVPGQAVLSSSSLSAIEKYIGDPTDPKRALSILFLTVSGSSITRATEQ